MAAVPPAEEQAGGRMPAGPLCSWAARRLVRGPIHYSIPLALSALPFAPPGGITNLEMQFHFGVLRYRFARRGEVHLLGSPPAGRKGLTKCLSQGWLQS